MHDPARGRALLYGGLGDTARSDLWELDTLVDRAGRGGPSGALAMFWPSPARLGHPFCIGFADPWPIGRNYGLLFIMSGPPLRPPLRVDPPALCGASFLCVVPQMVIEDFTEPFAFCILVPAEPALARAVFSFQGAALEVGACFPSTDALVAVLQP